MAEKVIAHTLSLCQKCLTHQKPGANGTGPAAQYDPRAIASSRAIRSAIGGCVENNPTIRSPERNGLAIIRCDSLASFGSGGSGACCTPAEIFRSADASA